MVCLKIDFLSNFPLHQWFPRKWYDLKLFSSQMVHFINVSSQIVRLKIVLLSSGPLYPCFTRKWYALKLILSDMVLFIHVSLANGTP